MKATVRFSNLNRGMYAAELERGGEFVVFELLDSSELEIDDIISHSSFYQLGINTIKNLTQNCEIKVCIENVCNQNNVKEYL